ncbi:hypothetical protein DAPPPG215_27230 [Pseudomonas syringae pv. tomato]|uniref:Uncharacterized protein n=1 Tax=Pseudomonas syringae pv. tomato TaxID=323 RepID=A0AAV1BTW7_PSEUB|nr:hypothetical protein DAPPPG215_27230 [Pseudomonas syringae pv. tomato]
MDHRRHDGDPYTFGTSKDSDLFLSKDYKSRG